MIITLSEQNAEIVKTVTDFGNGKQTRWSLQVTKENEYGFPVTVKLTTRNKSDSEAFNTYIKYLEFIGKFNGNGQKES